MQNVKNPLISQVKYLTLKHEVFCNVFDSMAISIIHLSGTAPGE